MTMIMRGEAVAADDDDSYSFMLAFAHTEKKITGNRKFEMGDRYRIIDLSHTITDAFITALFPV